MTFFNNLSSCKSNDFSLTSIEKICTEIICYTESITSELKGVWKRENQNMFASIHYEQFLIELALFILEEEAWT